MILEVDQAVVAYGSAIAVENVSFSIESGRMVALVGPNGAGKTSLVKAISGLTPLRSGEVRLKGQVAQVPEGRQMFGELNVDDNIRLGGWKSGNRDSGPMYDLFPDLRDRHKQLVS